MNYSTFINLDRKLLFWFNGSDSLFLDGLATTLTSTYLWIPLFIALFYLILKNNETMAQIFLAVSCALLCVIFSGGVSDYIAKPLVCRYRPSNDPLIQYYVDIVNNVRGTNYSFFSSHAANTMSLAVFFSLLVRNKIFNTVLFFWSLINGWTRLYLGLHYPSDVVFGFIWGGLVGATIYFVYKKIYQHLNSKQNFISGYYTSTGYSLADIDIVLTIFMLTCCISIIYGIISISNLY